jgi:hypothetical protein
MHQIPQTPPKQRGPSTITTARHMADAVGYLTRVASESGLLAIAGKLGHVRQSLLRVASGDSEDECPPARPLSESH